mgnify:CR=1 FL=1
MDQIELEALKGDVPIASTLRKVVALGGQVGSADLRDWASLELRGYADTQVDLPSYRRPGAVIKIDYVNLRVQATGQQIGPDDLPEGVRDRIDERVPLAQGIGEIEAMAQRARADGGSVMMAIPGASLITKMMNQDIGEPYQSITAVYWSLSESALEGVLDRVRTTLVELVAEMRAAMPASAESPSADIADQAVNIAVRGRGARITLNAPQIHGDGTIDMGVRSSGRERRSIWWKVGGMVVGVATILGAVAAIAQWQGWGI